MASLFYVIPIPTSLPFSQQMLFHIDSTWSFWSSSTVARLRMSVVISPQRYNEWRHSLDIKLQDAFLLIILQRLEGDDDKMVERFMHRFVDVVNRRSRTQQEVHLIIRLRDFSRKPRNAWSCLSLTMDAAYIIVAMQGVVAIALCAAVGAPLFDDVPSVAWPRLSTWSTYHSPGIEHHAILGIGWDWIPTK